MEDLPKSDDLMVPTLRAIAAFGGSASIDEIQERLIAECGFSEAQLARVYPRSGGAVLPDRMSWARSFLRMAGLLDNPSKGVWVITEEGRDAIDGDADAVRERARSAHRALNRARKAAEAAKPRGGGAIRDRRASDGNDKGKGWRDEDWPDRLLTTLRRMAPAAFERLCQRLLRESGFVRVQVTGKSGDGGIDGTGVLRVNLISFHVLFQCKRYAGSVGAGTVRDFRGAMQGRADKGLIITTGTFTAEARREATRDGAPAIDLIDGETLCLLLKDLRLGVAVSQRVVEEVAVDRTFFHAI